MAPKTTKKTTRKTTKKVASKKTTKKSVAAARTPLETARQVSDASPTVDIIIDHPKRVKLKSGRIFGNAQKKKIAIDMLERYTGHRIKDFQQQIILTNFHYYTERFNQILDDAIYTRGSAFSASSSKKAKVTIIEFGVGSAMAALVGELISVIEPKAVLFLGLAGAVHRSLKVGDFVLPIASVRAEGVSDHFLPPQVPALPTFKVQKFVSQILVEQGLDYRTGTIHSTDYRFWEFDEDFKENLIEERVLAVEMETAALFTSCFVSKVNIGALLLISDCPMKPGGIKTKKSAKQVFRKFTDIHIEIGIQAMADIAKRGEKIRHYTW
ncbi:MAG: AMP nucleosidase [Bacteriovoracaceae bacterium]